MAMIFDVEVRITEFAPVEMRGLEPTETFQFGQRVYELRHFLRKHGWFMRSYRCEMPDVLALRVTNVEPKEVAELAWALEAFETAIAQAAG